MESVNRYRLSVRGLAARTVGTSASNPKFFTQQREADVMTGRLMNLPEKQMDPIQDHDVESENLGGFKFMLGQDGLNRAPLS